MHLLESLSIGLCAWVATGVLFRAGFLLYRYWEWTDRLHNSPDWRLRWISKPLGWCGYCFSGQLGFWYYLLQHPYTWSLIENAIFALQSIFFWAVCDGINTLYKTFLEWLRTPPSA